MTVGEWVLSGIETDKNNIKNTIKDIQYNMRSDKNFYSHLYDDEILYVIYKEKIFKLKTHASTWNVAIIYGKQLGIPEEQLDFWPNRFQDECHYFEYK